MTVQELIHELQRIEDKEMTVVINSRVDYEDIPKYEEVLRCQVTVLGIYNSELGLPNKKVLLIS